MLRQNFLSKVFQKFISNKDIREFKGNLFYYIFYRIIRKFLKGNIKVLICNFFINASTNKKNMSNGLLNKCYFGDETILSVIKKISDQRRVFLLDCGSNYGFYSFKSYDIADMLVERISEIESVNYIEQYRDHLKTIKINRNY